jgi:hypothetical protein
MKLELEIFGSLCSTRKFVINDIPADSYDFGDQGDEDIENAEPYGCGNMRFRGKSSVKEVLEKYSISEDDYNEIVSELEKRLSFGCCGWCI